MKTYEIPSRSRPDARWGVTLDGDEASCGCPGFTHRGRCRHVTIARAIAADPEAAALEILRVLASERMTHEADRRAAREALRTLRRAGA